MCQGRVPCEHGLWTCDCPNFAAHTTVGDKQQRCCRQCQGSHEMLQDAHKNQRPPERARVPSKCRAPPCWVIQRCAAITEWPWSRLCMQQWRRCFKHTALCAATHDRTEVLAHLICGTDDTRLIGSRNSPLSSNLQSSVTSTEWPTWQYPYVAPHRSAAQQVPSLTRQAASQRHRCLQWSRELCHHFQVE